MNTKSVKRFLIFTLVSSEGIFQHSYEKLNLKVVINIYDFLSLSLVGVAQHDIPFMNWLDLGNNKGL